MPRPRLPAKERRERAKRISAKYGPPPYSKAVSKGIRWEKAGLVCTPSGKLVRLSKDQRFQMEQAAARAAAARPERKARQDTLRVTEEQSRRLREDDEWLLGQEPKRPETARTGEKTRSRAGAEKTAKTTRAQPGERKPRTVSEEARRLQDNVDIALKNLKDTKAAFGSGTVLARRAEDDYNEALSKLKAFKNRRKR